MSTSVGIEVIATYLEYVLSVLPLSIAILSVPPLSSFEGAPLEQLSGLDIELFRFIYSIVPPALLKKAYVNSLVLDSSSSTSLTPYVTHMFVHLNYPHLVRSLSGMIALGCPVFTQFGPLVTNLLFLGGGIAGALSFDTQQLKVVEFDPPLQNNNLLVSASKVLNTVVESTVKTLDEVRGRQYLGASGGVCAFLGANLVLLTKDTYRCVQDLVYYFNQKEPSLDDGYDTLRGVPALLWNTVQFTWFFSLLQLEMINTVSKRISLRDLFTFDHVNRAVHMQGFLFVAGVTCGLLLIQNNSIGAMRWKRNSRRLDD